MLDLVVRDRLERILESIYLIQVRTELVNKPSDLIANPDNMLLDSIAMRLQVIGEHVKKINSLDPLLFSEKLQIDPDPIIRFRDFISHHYEKTDFEIIYDIINNNLPPLEGNIRKFLTSNKPLYI